VKKIILFLLLPLLGFSQKIYHIRFNSSGIQYSVAVVIFDDNTGKMRTRYDNGGTSDKLVQMTVLLKNKDNGFMLLGSDALDVYTSTKANYNPDNFYVSFNQDQEDIVCKNIDDMESESECCIMEVIGKKNQTVFLK
jgi:hypothetical protein